MGERMTYKMRLWIGVGILCLAAVGVAAYLHSPRFGRPFSPQRLARVEASSHYINGHFENLKPVPVISGPDKGLIRGLMDYFMEERPGVVPEEPVPSAKVNLWKQDRNEDFVVWMGHSSFYMQLDGKRILVDPVFSDYASPIFFANRAFKGSNVYTADDIPPVDILVISHDHWDHLDYPTIMSLKDKIGKIVCPLGVGEYFEEWGFRPSQLYEEDWDSDVEIAPDFHIHVLTAQHFSGRLLERNPTEWASYAFITPTHKVYYSGDSGYGPHFRDIGDAFGGFDLALLENGQYDPQWHNIHMLPEETAQAATDLQARYVIPVHNSKFALARHAWQAPMQSLEKAHRGASWNLLTPEIGEKVSMQKQGRFSEWWVNRK